MIDYIYVVLPAVYGYVMQNFCPFVDKEIKLDRRLELKEMGLYDVNKVVWPLLFIMVGFSWSFARSKASSIQSLGKSVTKGSRKALSQFGKMFGKRSQVTSIDTAYVIFTLFFGWWMVLHTCTQDKRNSMIVLLLTTVSGMVLMYLITSYGKRGLFALLPVVMWLFFTGEYSLFNSSIQQEIEE